MPRRAHHRLIERDQRLRDSVRDASASKSIWLSTDQPRVLEDRQRVRNIGRPATDVVGDATASGISLRDRRQDRVVERRVSDVRLFGEEITRFSKERHMRAEYGTPDPGVEVAQALRDVIANELTTVRRSAADHGMQHRGKARIVGAPELRGFAVPQRLDDEFQAGSTPQWSVPGQEPAHD